MLLVRRFYPKRLTYSILWAIPTGAIWVKCLAQGHNDMLTAVGLKLAIPLLLNIQLDSAKAECNMRHQHLLDSRERTGKGKKKKYC